MNLLMGMIFILFSFGVQAQVRSDRGNCRLMVPGESDRLGRACYPGFFGISFNGYFVENQCYPSVRIAQDKLAQASYCDQEDHVGEFAILYPQQRDLQQQFCDQAFGITFRGHAAERRCWIHVGDAMTAMYEMAQRSGVQPTPPEPVQPELPLPVK